MRKKPLDMRRLVEALDSAESSDNDMNLQVTEWKVVNKEIVDSVNTTAKIVMIACAFWFLKMKL